VNEEGIILKPNGAVELYHDNSLKVSTTASGARVHDQLQVDGTIFAAVGLKVNADNQKIRLGASDDLELFHNGSNTYISNSTGNLMITGNNSDKIHIRAHASKQEIVCFPSGAVQLYHNDSLRFETTSTGARIPDSKALELGDRNSGGVQGDLRLYHDGSNSYIDEIGSGNLYIRNNTDNAIFCQTDGFVKLYYDGSEKLSTTSSGITVSGEVDATSDIKLKENIKTIENSLDKVLQLRGVEFDWKETKDSSIGLIAQEVEEVLPELVHETDDIKSVSYGNITAVLIEAIKEQNKIINTMKKEIEELKG
jgi:hypothetical protein